MQYNTIYISNSRPLTRITAPDVTLDTFKTTKQTNCSKIVRKHTVIFWSFFLS